MYRYDTLLFDADDTLFDFVRAERNALRGVLREFSLPCDESVCELYHQINKQLWREYEKSQGKACAPWSLRFKRLLDALNIRGDAEAVNDAYSAHLANQPDLLPDAADVCRRLCGTHRMYIITNGTPTVQRSRFNASEIRDCFDGIFISWELGFGKPDKRYFDAVAAEIAPADLSRALIIGDSLTSDIAGGINCGIDTCWFNPNGLSAPEELSPTYEIHSLKELYNIV